MRATALLAAMLGAATAAVWGGATAQQSETGFYVAGTREGPGVEATAWGWSG